MPFSHRPIPFLRTTDDTDGHLQGVQLRHETAEEVVASVNAPVTCRRGVREVRENFATEKELEHG